jgi:hypothetical protein
MRLKRLRKNTIKEGYGLHRLRKNSGPGRKDVPQGLERFRNYCGLIKIARCGFPWQKTTKRALASVYTNCETALKPDVFLIIYGTTEVVP